MEFYKIAARAMPDLKLKLLQARIRQSPEEYMRRTVATAAFLSLALLFIAFMFTKKPVVFLGLPVLFLLSFFYFLRYVDLKIEHLKRDISREIVYAGRFLLIEVESGVPLYLAFKNMARNYETIGPYFQELVDRVDLGTSMEDALNEMITLTPSPELRKVLWQILNSLRTGSEISGSLTSVFDQIVREQQIAVKEYGRKLNPLAMFYMMAAVIVPSLGTIMLIILISFLGLNMKLVVYAILAGLIGFIQFMFLAVIKSSRPPMEI